MQSFTQYTPNKYKLRLRKHTHTHEPSVSKEERERFRPNSVGQSKEKIKEEKITNDNDTFHYIARIKE